MNIAIANKINDRVIAWKRNGQVGAALGDRFLSHPPEPDSTVIVAWSQARPDHFEGRTHGNQFKIPFGEHLLFKISDNTGLLQTRESDAVGRIDVMSDHWSMSNFTTTTTFVIENLEGGAELIKVAPRRIGAVIPFEMSRVLIPSSQGMTELKIFGNPPTLLNSATHQQEADDGVGRLNEQSKYFLVLVALCEPRLRLSSMAAVPSVREVVDRLKTVPGFANINRSSVNYHIDYLRESKLALDEWSMSAHGGRMHSKREALVSYALRYDLVREEHLALLPPWSGQHAA